MSYKGLYKFVGFFSCLLTLSAHLLAFRRIPFPIPNPWSLLKEWPRQLCFIIYSFEGSSIHWTEPIKFTLLMRLSHKGKVTKVKQARSREAEGMVVELSINSPLVPSLRSWRLKCVLTTPTHPSFSLLVRQGILQSNNSWLNTRLYLYFKLLKVNKDI